MTGLKGSLFGFFALALTTTAGAAGPARQLPPVPALAPVVTASAENALATVASAAVDEDALRAFRFLRQATWGPRPGDVDRLVAGGNNFNIFLDQQFAAAPSRYPNTLYNQPIEMTQEHFMQLALTGSGPAPPARRVGAAQDLGRLGGRGDASRAIVTYYRLLMNGAFGNYRDLMRAVTLNPAMGRYLNMLNNRSEQVTGVPPNENYPRELMQLFTLGTSRSSIPTAPSMRRRGRRGAADLHRDRCEGAGAHPDRLDLRRRQSGDGPDGQGAIENYRVPMEAVARYHDTGAKVFLGQDRSRRARRPQQDLDQALDVIFNHPNVAPFVSRQLIQQLVTSNPSPRVRRGDRARSSTTTAPACAAIWRRWCARSSLHPEAGARDTTLGQAVRAGAVRRRRSCARSTPR